MNIASSSPPRRDPRIGDQLRAVQKKEAWPCLQRSASSQCKLECESPSLPSWSLKTVDIQKTFSLLFAQGELWSMFFSGCSESAYSGHHLVFCNRQSVEGGGITAIIPFTMRGSSKAKCSVQDAGRTNRLAQREIRVPLHQAEGRLASPFCVPHTTDLMSLLLGVLASCSSQTRVVLWAQRTPVWDFLMFLIWEWMRPRRSQSSPKKTITIQSLANEACRLKGHGRFAKK